ncbi:MAG: hypothetical protein AAGB46_12140 [Verrucomicrobiota bacterium]
MSDRLKLILEPMHIINPLKILVALSSVTMFGLLSIASLFFAALPIEAKKKSDKQLQEEEIAEETGTMAFHLLAQLNEREQEAYTAYSTALDEGDIDKIKRDLQSIVDGYDKLIGIAPDYAPAFVSYGQMLKRIGERDAANAMFIRADEIDPGLPLVKNQLGNYMAEEGKFLEALGYYLIAAKLAPDEALYPYQMGNLLQSYKKLFIAEKMYKPKTIDMKIQENFKKAMDLSPEKTEYQFRYAQSFFEVSNPNWMLALEQWHDLANKAGGEFEKQLVLISTARVRIELGHVTAAKKILKDLDHPEVQNARLELYGMIDREMAK